MLNFYKNRLIKLILVLMAIYFGLVLYNNIKNINENVHQLIEKTIFLSSLVSLVNFIYPTI
jgi:hypothetical protein